MGISIYSAKGYRLAPELVIVEEVEAFDPATGEYPEMGRVIYYESPGEEEVGSNIPSDTTIMLEGPLARTGYTYTSMSSLKSQLRDMGAVMPVFFNGFTIHGQVSGQALASLVKEFDAIDREALRRDASGFDAMVESILNVIIHAGPNGIVLYN